MDLPYDTNEMPLPHGERTSFADHEEPSGSGPSTMDRAHVRENQEDAEKMQELRISNDALLQLCERQQRELDRLIRYLEDEASSPRLAAGIRRIEQSLQQVVDMNGRELAALARIDKATTQIGAAVTNIGTETTAVAAELKALIDAGTGDDEVDKALEAAADKLDGLATSADAAGAALALVATPQDPNPTVAELVTSQPTEP